MEEEQRLESQVVSQAIKAGLSTQIDQAKNLEVSARTSWISLMQGQVDSVAVNAEGLETQNIHLETIELQVENLSVNPLSALLGKLKLDQPARATARMFLTETDLNQAMNSTLAIQRTPPLSLDVAGEAVVIELQHPIAVHLPGSSKVQLTGSALLHEPKQSRSLGFTVVLLPGADSSVYLESFQCHAGGKLSLEFTIALLQTFKALLERPFFEIEGIRMRVKQMEVAEGGMTLETEAFINQLPAL